MSPATAIQIGRLGGLGVLNLEGLWTRYEDPEPLLRGDRRRRGSDAGHPADAGDLRRADQGGADRQADRRDPGGRRAGGRRAVTAEHPGVRAARWSTPRVDFFVIRGTTVSAEHVSSESEPLNLKQFIYALDVPVIVGGCATYQAALHLMRTGAAGVLVGFGGGAAHTTRSVLGRGRADGVGGLRRRRGPPGLPGRVRRPLRARDRRRLGRPVRRHRQGDRLRCRRGDGRLAAGQGRGGARPRLPLGSGGLARQPAARRAGAVRRRRHPGADPARPVHGRPTAR